MHASACFHSIALLIAHWSSSGFSIDAARIAHRRSEQPLQRLRTQFRLFRRKSCKRMDSRRNRNDLDSVFMGCSDVGRRITDHADCGFIRQYAPRSFERVSEDVGPAFEGIAEAIEVKLIQQAATS